LFTGIIEEIGSIEDVRIMSESAVLKIKCDQVLDRTKLGDSIAVNGVCLTVTELGSNFFKADVMHVTFNVTNLKLLQRGSKVNLERALTPESRLGGHFVSGHVDSLGKIIKYDRKYNSVDVGIILKKESAANTLKRGSIAIDGISLTISDKYYKGSDVIVEVSIIPHTQEETTLLSKRMGEYVNIETDMLGKMVGNMNGQQNEGTQKKRNGITLSMLKENGFA